MTLPPARAITVLGIETSCDETAAAVVRRNADGRAEILSDIVLSQIAGSRRFRRGRAGNRGARACRRARWRDPRGDEIRHDVARPRRCCRDRRTRPDRRASGRDHDGARVVGGEEDPAPAAEPPRRPRADGAAHRRRWPFPICCFSSPAGIRSSSPSKASAATGGSAPPSTTRSAKPSTRPPSFWASPIPAGRTSSERRRRATQNAFPCRVRCTTRPAATFPSPD